MFKLVLEKAEEPEIKLPTSVASSKKQESCRYTSTSALLTIPKPLIVWITTNCGKFFKRWEIPDHLTCLLRNLYAGQGTTIRTGHVPTDWFQIQKRSKSRLYIVTLLILLPSRPGQLSLHRLLGWGANSWSLRIQTCLESAHSWIVEGWKLPNMQLFYKEDEKYQ